MAKKPDLKKAENELITMLEQLNPLELKELQKSMGQLVGKLEAPVSEQEELLDAAQNLMFEAMECTKKSKRLKLTYEALDMSPFCADAYLMLADEVAKDEEQRLDMLLSAASAGEGAMEVLGYEKDVGQYWGIIETRPYMRALHLLGLEYIRRADLGEAKSIFQHMLKLNPNDNQGVRYHLLTLLLQLGKPKDASKLHKKYKDESSAFWGFGGALLAFMEAGEGAVASKKLAEAREINSHVTPYLSGQKKLPKQMPGYYSPGEESEAQSYLVEAMAVWQSVPGALDWLKGEVLGKKML